MTQELFDKLHGLVQRRLMEQHVLQKPISSNGRLATLSSRTLHWLRVLYRCLSVQHDAYYSRLRFCSWAFYGTSSPIYLQTICNGVSLAFLRRTNRCFKRSQHVNLNTEWHKSTSNSTQGGRRHVIITSGAPNWSNILFCKVTRFVYWCLGSGDAIVDIPNAFQVSLETARKASHMIWQVLWDELTPRYMKVCTMKK